MNFSESGVGACEHEVEEIIGHMIDACHLEGKCTFRQHLMLYRICHLQIAELSSCFTEMVTVLMISKYLKIQKSDSHWLPIGSFLKHQVVDPGIPMNDGQIFHLVLK